MQDFDASKLLQNVLNYHRNDKDGGYDTVRSFQAVLRDCNQTEKEALSKAMLEAVIKQEKSWGTMIGALGPEEAPFVGAQLADLLTARGYSLHTREEVCLALLSMKYMPAVERCRDFIVAELRDGQRSALPLLAAFLSINASECIRISKAYILGELCRGQGIEQFKGSFTCLLAWFIKVDKNLLIQLIREISEQDINKGEELKVATLERLSTPWAPTDYGASVVAELKQALEKL